MQIESAAKRSQVVDENRTAIRHLFERVYSKGELNLIDNVVTSDFVGDSTESPHAHLGREGIRTHVIQLRTAFREFTVEIDDLRVQGDTFDVTWAARGTHEGRFHGVDPTCNIGRPGEEPHGNRIVVSGDSRGTIRDGKVRENRMSWSVEELRRQLGAAIEDSEPDAGAGERAGRNPPLLDGTAGAIASTLAGGLDGERR